MSERTHALALRCYRSVAGSTRGTLERLGRTVTLYERMQDGTAPAGAFGYRTPFDPREHTDLALRAAAPQAKTGLFRKLLGD